MSATVSRVVVQPKVDTIFARDSLLFTDAVQLQAAVVSFGGSVVASPRVTWSTRDTAIATVDSTGVVRPRRLGTATITASSGNKNDQATVAVVWAARRLAITSPVLSFNGFPQPVDSVFLGDAVRAADARVLRAVALDAQGDTVRGVRYVWSTSNPAVALVDSTGLLRPVGFGTATITARGADLTATRQVTVLSAVRGLNLLPRNDSIFVLDPIRATDTKRFTATPVLWESAPRDLRITTRWAVSQPSVARVDTLGLVTALGLGPATVTATAAGFGESAAVTVLSAVREIRVTAPPARVLTEDTLRLRATAIGYRGDTLTVPLVWRSTTASATVVDSSSGVVRFNTTGPVGFTATGAFMTGRTAADVQVLDRVYLSVDAGWDHTCSVIQLGRVYCWGRRAEGQLGSTAQDSTCFDGGTAATPCSMRPRQAATPLGYTRLESGTNTTCGIASAQPFDPTLAAGRAYCWGTGSAGQLGNGTAGASQVPTLVTSALQFEAATGRLSVGGQHACGITSPARMVYCWGSDADGQLGTQVVSANSSVPIPAELPPFPNGPTPMQWVSAGHAHTCAVTTAGQAFCWGRNTDGEIGVGSVGADVTIPVAVAGGFSFRAISASTIAFGPAGTAPITASDTASHTCGLTTDGRAVCWGANYAAQLGNGVAGPSIGTPAAVNAPVAFTAISAGGGFTCALGADRNIYCWGRNDVGQLATGSVTSGHGTPLAIASPTAFTEDGEIVSVAPVSFLSVSAGRRHACGLATDGWVYCWGSDVMGALGSRFTARVQPRPMRVAKPL